MTTHASSKNTQQKDDHLARMRLDKWLWAARFFKTRSLATQACDGGKVHVGGQRAKPSHNLCEGSVISLRRGEDDLEIVVKQLSEQRGPASAAQMLYEETAASVARREQHAEQRRLQRLGTPISEGRPDKKGRRALQKWQSSHE